MITADLYTTSQTYYVGYTTNQFTEELTERWLRSDGTNIINDLSAYWLGWIRKDNLPALYRVSAVYFDTETGDLHFDDITDESNFPCGYVNGAASNVTTLYTNIDGVDDYRSNNARLLNNVHPEFSGLMYNYNNPGSLIISGRYILFDAGDNVIYPTTWNNYLPQVTILRNNNNSSEVLLAYNFIFGGAEQQFKITYNNTDYFFTCTFDDFAEGTALLHDDSNTVSARIFITEIAFGQGGSYNNNNQTNLNTTWCCKINGTFGTHTIEKIQYGFDYSANVGTSTYTMRNYDNDNPGLGLFAYAQDVVFPAAIVSALKTGSEKYHWIGNVCGYHLTNDALFFAFFTANDIKKSFSLFYRVALAFLPGYVRNITYATDVTTNNEFLAKLKTGDLTDINFKNGLREWQYTDFQSDDFTEDDIPPYTPPGPEPRPDPEPPEDDAEHGGDDIEPSDVSGLGATFGFTTQYALRGSQIQELGAKLWAGFDRNNPDIDAFIQNFVYSVDPDTGSVNMSDIMEFFISLRAYPMPLGNLTSITAAGNDLYIGAGTHPITLTDYIHTADSYLEPVDAGTVSVPFWFGDYRDYKTEITLYLPYCGTAELNPADVMGCTLDCTYVVDLSTGSCTAYVWTKTWENHRYPVAILPGQLGVDIPITASNAGRVGARLLGDRINFAENIMSVLKNTATGIGAVTSGNIGTGIRATMSAFIDPAIQEQKQLSGMADRGAIAAPMLSGGRGLAAFRNPATAYVQVRSPFYAVPEHYSESVGDPAATYVQIGNCSGLCQFVNVDVSGITTDAADQAEIRRALENGIYI